MNISQLDHLDLMCNVQPSGRGFLVGFLLSKACEPLKAVAWYRGIHCKYSHLQYDYSKNEELSESFRIGTATVSQEESLVHDTAYYVR